MEKTENTVEMKIEKNHIKHRMCLTIHFWGKFDRMECRTKEAPEVIGPGSTTEGMKYTDTFTMVA